MYNLGTVISFEILRTLKKKTFWLTAIGFPVMLAVIYGIAFLSAESSHQASEKLKDQKFSIAITDDSKLLNPALINVVNAKTTTNKSEAINDVKSGKIDSFIYYPKDLTKNPIEIYGQNVSIFDNGRYSSIAEMLIQESVSQSIPEQSQLVIKGNIKSKLTTYQNGEIYNPIQEMILPSVFLILFYLLIAFFGNQMLTSTTEEKENRVIEIILTTIKARTLIIGKIISLVILAFIQGLIVILPAIISYVLLKDNLNIPNINISELPFDIVRMSIGAIIFALGFLEFTGLMVLIGASVPTAKEASGFIGIIIMLIFGPLYAVTLFITNPELPFIRFLTIFPLTAPIPALLRNAAGNLQVWEILSLLALMLITTVIILFLAVRVFRYGALEYNRKLSLREIFSK